MCLRLVDEQAFRVLEDVLELIGSSAAVVQLQFPKDELRKYLHD